jgi:hypothetical protein
MRHRVYALIVSFLLPILAAGSESSVSLREAAQQFSIAYAAGDRDALREVWSGPSWLDQRFANKARVKCIDSSSAVVTSMDDANNVARATIARWETRRDGEAPPQLVVEHLIVAFELRDGRLVATKLDVAENALADQLIANPSDASAILRLNNELVTPSLTSQLSERVAGFTSRGEFQ